MHRYSSLRWALVLVATLSLSCRPATKPAAPPAETNNFVTMLEVAREHHESVSAQDLQIALRKFQTELGRLPTNLVELVIYHYLPGVPAAADGFEITYDPVHGNVGIRKAAPASGIDAPPEPPDNAGFLPRP